MKKKEYLLWEEFAEKIDNFIDNEIIKFEKGEHLRAERVGYLIGIHSGMCILWNVINKQESVNAAFNKIIKNYTC